jgi:hypothetical protein
MIRRHAISISNVALRNPIRSLTIPGCGMIDVYHLNERGAAGVSRLVATALKHMLNDNLLVSL